MIRWKLIGIAAIPNDGGEMQLYEHDTEFAIRVSGQPGDLMNSRMHGSEDALGSLACERLRDNPNAQVLIGGLGMGFTLAATLQCLHADAQAHVAELVPTVVEWNRTALGACANYPLTDYRVRVTTTDVVDDIAAASAAYDAIVLDVDNGPEAFSHEGNDRLYTTAGLSSAYRALRPGGVLAVWSVTPAPRFTGRLKQAGFRVTEQRVRAHRGKGARHTIWLASRP